MSHESASLCEKFDVYIGNFDSSNAKGIIKNAVLNIVCECYCVLCVLGFNYFMSVQPR